MIAAAFDEGWKKEIWEEIMIRATSDHPSERILDVFLSTRVDGQHRGLSWWDLDNRALVISPSNSFPIVS